MRRTLSLFALAALSAAACTPASTPSSAPGTADADSVVLERTRCYGFCPAYRVTLARTGEVRFVSSYPDEGRRETGRVSGPDFDALVRGADAAGFWTTPEKVQDDARLCGAVATDLPTVIVEIYAAGRSHRVEDYRGCRDVPQALRAWEDRIDTVAGTSRWARSGTTR